MKNIHPFDRFEGRRPPCERPCQLNFLKSSRAAFPQWRFGSHGREAARTERPRSRRQAADPRGLRFRGGGVTLCPLPFLGTPAPPPKGEAAAPLPSPAREAAFLASLPGRRGFPRLWRRLGRRARLLSPAAEPHSTRPAASPLVAAAAAGDLPARASGQRLRAARRLEPRREARGRHPPCIAGKPPPRRSAHGLPRVAPGSGRRGRTGAPLVGSRRGLGGGGWDPRVPGAADLRGQRPARPPGPGGAAAPRGLRRARD